MKEGGMVICKMGVVRRNLYGGVGVWEIGVDGRLIDRV